MMSVMATDDIQLRDVARGAARLVPRWRGLLSTTRAVLRANPSARVSIGTLLERNAQEHGDRAGLLFEDQRYTHAEINAWANRFARHLADSGVRAGDSVAVMISNRPELIFVVAAVAKLGAVATMINTNQRGDVLVHSLRVGHARRIVVGEELAHAFEAVRARADVTDVHVVDDALTAEIATRPAGDAGWAQQVLSASPAFHIYTSGTTGLPKASVMSQSRWVKAGHVYGQAMMGLTPDDVLYCALPFYHNMALTLAWSSSVATGAALAIAPSFSARRFWDDCRRHGATAIAYIGEIPRYLLNQPARDDDADNPVVKAVGVGMRPDIWSQFKSRFGVDQICENYSSSETNTVFVNMLNLDGTIGFCPTPHVLVQYDADKDEIVRNEKGRPQLARTGEAGLLLGLVTPIMPFDGYTDEAAGEARLMRDVFVKGDVWFNSGDLLKKVGWGHAVFVDRVGDTFRWKGENVSTTEVEAALTTATGVEDCTVYGVTVEGADGRAGMAALVGEVDMKTLAAHLTAALPRYAVPVFVRVRDELERTGTFKHRKGDLRKAGFDPGSVDDALFVLLGGADHYVPLTPEVFESIQAGRVRI